MGTHHSAPFDQIWPQISLKSSFGATQSLTSVTSHYYHPYQTSQPNFMLKCLMETPMNSLGFYFINSPLRPFFHDFQIRPPSQILPPCQYTRTHMKKLAKRLYKTVRGFRKCLWGIPSVSGLGHNPDTNSMELLFWDGGSTF